MLATFTLSLKRVCATHKVELANTVFRADQAYGTRTQHVRRLRTHLALSQQWPEQGVRLCP